MGRGWKEDEQQRVQIVLKYKPNRDCGRSCGYKMEQ